MIQEFGLDQIPTAFTGSVSSTNVVGPGSYIGRMDLDGGVETPGSISETQTGYSF